MKKAVLILSILLTSLTGYSQNIAGQWYGLLKVGTLQLRIGFNISKTETGYSSTLDSPDQGAKNIPVQTTTFENAVLKIDAKNLGIAYEGVLQNDSIMGDLKQRGQVISLNLSRNKIEKELAKRPQEPVKPYPYYSEDITFENADAKITLAGTLTLPSKTGKFPVVVLITGSGPQNRDEEMFGHKPFLVLADYLTKQGIGVLRFDDRGVAQSKGNFKTATTVEFAADVTAAVSYLKTRNDININKIGLIGHSEGGIIAPMVAVKSKDIKFIVLLAGTGIPGDSVLLLQNELLTKAAYRTDKDWQDNKRFIQGAYEIVKKDTNTDSLKKDLKTYVTTAPAVTKKGMSDADFSNLFISQLANPWMQYFIKYDPSIVLRKVKCPVLALNGENDLQVAAQANLQAIKKALEAGGNKNVTIKELPKLNHLLQESTTGSLDEYAKIEQTFSPVALQELTNWILARIK